MKKRILAILLILCIVMCLFTSCGENTAHPRCEEKIEDEGIYDESTEASQENNEISEESSEEISYEDILSGDFSSVAGMYKRVSGETFELLSDGTDGIDPDDDCKVEYIKALDDGSYNWTLAWYYDGEVMSSVGYSLYPEGVDVIAYDGSILNTDTSKIRLWVSNIAVMNARDAQYIYYKID